MYVFVYRVIVDRMFIQFLIIHSVLHDICVFFFHSYHLFRLFSLAIIKIYVYIIFHTNCERKFHHRFIPPSISRTECTYENVMFFFYEKLLHSIRHIKWIKCKSNFYTAITLQPSNDECERFLFFSLSLSLFVRVCIVFVYGFPRAIIAFLPT